MASSRCIASLPWRAARLHRIAISPLIAVILPGESIRKSDIVLASSVARPAPVWARSAPHRSSDRLLVWTRSWARHGGAVGLRQDYSDLPAAAEVP